MNAPRSLTRTFRVQQAAPSALAIIAAIACLTATALLPAGVARGVLGVPLALVIPGWAMLSILRIDLRLEPLLRLALTVMITLACYPLLVLLIAALQFKITHSAVIVAVDALLLLCAAVIAVRDGAMRKRFQRNAEDLGSVRVRGADLSVVAVLVTVAAAAALLAGTWALAPHQAPGPYASIAFTGANAQIDKIVTVDSSSLLRVTVTVTNASPHAERFSLTGVPDGARAWSPRTVQVPAHGLWSGTLTGVVIADGCARRLRVEARSPDHQPIFVDLWFSSASVQTCAAQ
ncbi:MAG: hypothetical protein ACLPVY_21450 [Acidimicrobiia bacterium]